ncbi:hypothetical protein [Rhizobium sp. L51/94]|uniref:hypothetical protein n=1 Tax=Rhizobium sp. L51/94 TaxID=2819999 RepID=UPI001C5B9C8B|nr:hypothetical protein [Rhizobium sp. L51/94]QXZ81275.1 hypothetical protein J5274_20530 [Rhizobium sp. L51/94]
MRFDLWQFFQTTQGSIILGVLLGAGSIAKGVMLSRSLLWAGIRRPQRVNRRREERMLAMRVVLALDDLVGGCHSAAIDAPEFNPSDAGDFVLHTEDPRLILPKDVDWSLLSPELAEEVLWMPNRLRNILDALESLDVNAPEFDDFFLHRQADFSKLGLRAMDIIDTLCAEYGIEAPERPLYYDPRATFEEGVALAVDFTDRRRKSQKNASTGRSNVTPLFGNGGIEAKTVKPSDKDPIA